MGNPQHYSLELPQRCMELLDSLWEPAMNVYGASRPHLGPLSSTFLLTMSMPMLIVPLERMERQTDKAENQSFANDGPLHPLAAQAFTGVIREGNLGDAPFYDEGAWRFYCINEGPFPNIAKGLPQAVADALSDDAAVNAATKMHTRQWISILRNALAHGGIAYLDEDGRSSEERPVKMFAFLSGKFDNPRCAHADAKCRSGSGALKRVNILQIREEDYRRFLRRWVEWLAETHITTSAAE